MGPNRADDNFDRVSAFKEGKNSARDSQNHSSNPTSKLELAFAVITLEGHSDEASGEGELAQARRHHGVLQRFEGVVLVQTERPVAQPQRLPERDAIVKTR